MYEAVCVTVSNTMTGGGGGQTPRWRWWVSNMAAKRIFGSACWHGCAKVVRITTYTRPLEP